MLGRRSCRARFATRGCVSRGCRFGRDRERGFPKGRIVGIGELEGIARHRGGVFRIPAGSQDCARFSARGISPFVISGI